MNPNRRAVFSLLMAFLLFAACLPAEKMAVSDDAISDMVRRKLANDPDVKGGRLSVEVKDGVVTLAGQVEQPKFKNKAEKLARKIRGVKSVVNNLTVGRPG
jgi:hyperosmotically inducible periplasmic protein